MSLGTPSVQVRTRYLHKTIETLHALFSGLCTLRALGVSKANRGCSPTSEVDTHDTGGVLCLHLATQKLSSSVSAIGVSGVRARSWKLSGLDHQNFEPDPARSKRAGSLHCRGRMSAAMAKAPTEPRPDVAVIHEALSKSSS